MAEDASDGDLVVASLLHLADEAPHHDRVGEGMLGVGPPLLHAEDRVAAHLGNVGRIQVVVEARKLLHRKRRSPSDLAGQDRVHQHSSAKHHVARLGVGREQLVHVLDREDVAVVHHGKRRSLERLAVELASRLAVVAIILHARMHDELGQRHTAVQLEDSFVLVGALEAQARLDRDGQRRALAHVREKGLEPVEVTQEPRPLAL